MKRTHHKLICYLRGHKYVRWDEGITGPKFCWSNILHAECQRCGKHVIEHRYGFVRGCGSLTYIENGEIR